jgi:hypothetical protein
MQNRPTSLKKKELKKLLIPEVTLAFPKFKAATSKPIFVRGCHILTSEIFHIDTPTAPKIIKYLMLRLYTNVGPVA